MQQRLNHFSRACNDFGFTISTNKTESMHQPAPRKMYHDPRNFVNDEQPMLSSTREAPSREKPTLTIENQLCIWETQEESVGTTRNQPRHQAKRIHGCGANCHAVCMCVMDCVQPSRQEIQPHPY